MADDKEPHPNVVWLLAEMEQAGNNEDDGVEFNLTDHLTFLRDAGVVFTEEDDGDLIYISDVRNTNLAGVTRFPKDDLKKFLRAWFSSYLQRQDFWWENFEQQLVDGALFYSYLVQTCLCFAWKNKHPNVDFNEVVRVNDIAELSMKLVMMQRLADHRNDHEGQFSVHLFTSGGSNLIEDGCREKLQQLERYYSPDVFELDCQTKHELGLRQADVPFFREIDNDEVYLTFCDTRVSGLSPPTFDAAALQIIVQDADVFKCGCYRDNCDCREKSVFISDFINLRLHWAKLCLKDNHYQFSGRKLMKLSYQEMKKWGHWKTEYINLKMGISISMFIDATCVNEIQKAKSSP